MLADFVKLPKIWRSVPDFTGLAPLRLLRASSQVLACDGDVVISDPCELLLIQWVWFAGQEDKHFLLSPEHRWIWLCERDRRELRHFYGRHPSNPFFASSCEGGGRLQINWPEFPAPSSSGPSAVGVVRCAVQRIRNRPRHFVVEPAAAGGGDAAPPFC